MIGETRTTCPYCGVGCGLIAGPDGIAGDPAHPANRGAVCTKGATLGLTLDDSARILHPRLGGRRLPWEAALDLASTRFRETIAAHGPDSVAFYVSGQFLTEDYYAANKLMKGFIGSGNIDTNSRLCMASPVAAHLRAFGEDVVPGVYEDFDEADLILFVGSNASWCHPVLFRRALAARAARGTVIVAIDPRRSATADIADLHIPVAPGGDSALFAALLVECAARGVIAYEHVGRHTRGFEAALAAARTARHDVDPELFGKLADLVVRTPRMVTAFSQGVNQSETGTDVANAIINLHLATGRIGRPGAAPFSLTGQPNAMGGREVGGLATQLAAHIGFEDAAAHAELVAAWGAPGLARRPGLKAVEMFEAVRRGQIRAIWIAGTNPAESLPDTAAVRGALDACPFVVVADCWETATTARADLVLPAAGWSEKNGTVTNSERTISRQRPFRAPPGEARPDWWMFAQLGRRLGHEAAFAWRSPADVFREHCAMTAIGARAGRLLNLSPLASMSDDAYDAMAPTRWPLTGDRRLFGEGRFPTPDGQACFVPVSGASPLAREPGQVVLNTGRLRDQWHMMTRTGAVPALRAHREMAEIEISPADAASLAVVPGDLLCLTGRGESLVLPVAITDAQRQGEVFVPLHWTAADGSAASVNRLVTPVCDPVSGEPAFKHCRALIRRVAAAWHGVALSRTPVASLPPGIVWSVTPREDGLLLLRLAGLDGGAAPVEPVLDLIAGEGASLDHADPGRTLFRRACFHGTALDALVFIARERGALPSPDLMAERFERAWPVRDPGRLFGASGVETARRSRTVCVCQQVSEATIREAILRSNCTDVGALGRITAAGTGCGTCLPELKAMIDAEHVAEPV